MELKNLWITQSELDYDLEFRILINQEGYPEKDSTQFKGSEIEILAELQKWISKKIKEFESTNSEKMVNVMSDDSVKQKVIDATKSKYKMESPTTDKNLTEKIKDSVYVKYG